MIPWKILRMAIFKGILIKNTIKTSQYMKTLLFAEPLSSLDKITVQNF